MKLLVRSTAAMLAVAAGLAAVAPAEAGPYRYRRGVSPGAAAAVGVLGGLAIGSAIAAGAARPAPVYVAPPPPEAVIEDECYVERRRVYVPGWGWESRRRTICE